MTITLQTKELVFDIQNKTYLTGRSREGEDASRFVAASNMQTSDDAENAYQVHRSLSNALATLRTAFAEYLSSESTTADNLIESHIDGDTAVTIPLTMPANYNPATAETVGAAFHQYLVNEAIADWFTITNKTDAAEYKSLAQSALDTARRALYKRKRPTRPTYGS
ncbi:MAG: hypothetical protein LIP03_09360 [Bacteroidales bacterium]|nr:hypothetical protein [Bacteroidales bacterium]